MPSVFQNLKDSMPPLIPAPQPMVNELGDPIGEPRTNELGDALPDAPAKAPEATGKKPQVFTSPQDEIGQHLQSKLDTDYQKDLHPWGTPENHPGVFGKIAHALNYATGGDTRRGWEEKGLEGRLGTLAGENATNDYKAAETGKTREETAEMPAKAASEEGMQGAQTENLKSEAAEHNASVANGPSLANAYAHAVNQAMQSGRDPSTDPIVQHLSDAITSVQKQPTAKGMEKVNIVGPDGKPVVANYHPETGKITDASGKEISNAKPYEKSPEGPHQLMMMPDGQGGYTATNVLPGMHVQGNAMTATGVNTMNTPTSTMRTGAGRAAMVNEAIPGVLADIEKNKEQMGPLMGRWNDFMQGKVGSDNPDFAALRMDLTLMGTAVALAHAQGRLPENLREEFDRAINAPQQTPENLEAAIKAVQPWMARMQEAGQVPHSQESGKPIIQHSASTGQYRYSNDGGKTWQAGQPKQ